MLLNPFAHSYLFASNFILYLKIFGTPMEGGLSSVLDGVVMDLLAQVLPPFRNNIYFLHKYVDDNL